MNNKNFIIRKAKPEDCSVIAEAQREIAKTPGLLASRPEELKDETIKSKIIELSNSARGYSVVLESHDKIIGHAFLEPHKLEVTSHVVFLTIAIHEGHQGQGWGKILMNHLIEWAKANPLIEKFELQVRSSNLRAIKLYEQLGFQQEGRKTKQIKIAPGQYLDNVYMAFWVGN